MKAIQWMIGTALAATFVAGAASAQPAEQVKIGVLGDQAGPYSSITGPGSVVAAKLAIEDMGGTVLGKPVELVVADHKHKPDLGSSIARRWYDTEHVDAIFDIYNSGVALAVQQLAQEKNKILMSTVNSGELTGKSCARNGMQWGPDGYALATLTVKGVGEKDPGSWYFMTVDYTAGHSIEKDERLAVDELGGKILGAVRFPLGTTDFSSYLLQAQASKANNVGFAGGGSDLLNAIKQANEFQIDKTGQRFVSTSLTTADIEALGNEHAAGYPVVFSFYWDLSPETKAWSERFRKASGKMPTDMQADVYSAVLHYLKAVKAAGTTDTDKVLDQIYAMPVNDVFTHDAKIRADGRLMRDMYFGVVKAPDQMKDKDDLIDVQKKFTGEQSFLPAARSECPLLQ